MTKESIITAINAIVITPRLWRIGITQDLDERKKHWGQTENKNITAWRDWEADSLKDAQEIEAMFIAKGMQGGVGGDMSPYKKTFVYIF